MRSYKRVSRLFDFSIVFARSESLSRGLGVLTCFGQMINLMYLVLGFDICLDFFFF